MKFVLAGGANKYLKTSPRAATSRAGNPDRRPHPPGTATNGAAERVRGAGITGYTGYGNPPRGALGSPTPTSRCESALRDQHVEAAEGGFQAFHCRAKREPHVIPEA